ncbi:MAG: carbohydrate ABC transporter permease [Candidatus Caldatribacterium sp.]|nr:carbohydrate ABC transporter permease [Candidatus Caldatribacterium sp.]
MRKHRGWKWSALVALVVALVISPLYFIAIGGFMSTEEIFHKPPYLFPPRPSLAYYREAILTLSPYIKNSFIIAFGTLLLTLLVALPAPFVLTKFRFSLKGPVDFLFALVQMLPYTAVIVPLFLMFTKLKLIDSHLGVMLALSVFLVPFAVIILRSYMISVPSGLIEAALIDGAGYFKIFTSIVLPLSAPGIASVAILVFLLAWGSFIVPLAFIKAESMRPLSIGLYVFIGQYGVEWNKLMAGSMIYTIPPLVVALLAGKSIVAGLTAGAFKE